MQQEKVDSTDGLTSEQVLQLVLPSDITTGRGGHLYDGRGVPHIDMLSAWGANLLGYGYPRVSKAVSRQAYAHLNLGVAGPEYKVFEDLLLTHIPSAEAIYPLKNGSDATAVAIRLARHITGRTRVLYWGYHGAQDWYMAALGVPGVPESQRADITELEALTAAAVRDALSRHPGEIACLILDPFHWPMASASVMAEIKEVVREHGALLIFDEVLSGFRAHVGGMQAVWGVHPDLTCLGKGIANGMPLSVLVGREEFMRHVYEINYSLTFRLEAMSIVAAIETIREIVDRDVCNELARKGRVLKAAYGKLAAERGISSAMIGHDSRPQLAFFNEDGLVPGTSNYLVIKELAARRICTYGTFSICFSHTDEDIQTVIDGLAAGLDKVAQISRRPTAPADNGNDTASAVASDPLCANELLSLKPGEVEQRLRHFGEAEIEARFFHDPWLKNYLLSIWERSHGVTHLRTRPWAMTLSVVATCNADCHFCTVPLRRTRNPAMELDLDAIPHLVDTLKYNKILIITGGEPTIHPRFGPLMTRLGEVIDPRAHVMMITHGHRLHRFKAELEAVPVHLQISINAANAATHHRLMRLGEGAFDQIIESARWARSIGRNVEFSMVVLRDNLDQVPALLRLSEELGVSGVYLRTLIPGNFYAARFDDEATFDSYAAWGHPDFERLREEAREAIARTSVQVYTDTDQWGVRLQSAKIAPDERTNLLEASRQIPPLVRTAGMPVADAAAADAWRTPTGNPYGRSAPLRCDAPRHVMKVLEQNLRVDVCGFLQHVKGHEDVGLFSSENFDAVWNSPALVHVRESLNTGPLLPECETCPYQMTGDWMSNSVEKGVV